MSNDTTAPTVTRIQEMLDAYAGQPGFRAHPDGVIYAGDLLTAATVAAHWAEIEPDDNEGAITDPIMATVHGAIMNTNLDLWVLAEDRATLYDFETGEPIGPATTFQTAASFMAGPEGHILIDADGDVVEPGTWAAQQPGTRKVYVA